ncbi:MAG: energy transducer TonB [Dysgonamonadaceae bacterium]|jgi:protein TonB|nr:energy transducer TonB [Dysgonamonadaceae bacterium]
MKRDIDLASQEWLDLIFEGKNKNYGAYVLRDESSNRHFKALIIVTLAGLCAIFLPKLVSSVLPTQQVITHKTTVNLTEVILDQDTPEEIKAPKVEVPPPPLLLTTIQFTPPVVIQGDVRDEDLMHSQLEITDSQADISIIDVDGVKKDGIDIADLDKHKIITKEKEEETKTIVIVDYAQVPPQFPGGDKELMKYLSENIHYPSAAIAQGIEGRVVLRFVVTNDGSIDNVEVIRSLNPSCDKEAVRVVKSMPKWNPGKQNGNAVYVYYNLPVLFKLQN